jgi:CheY-like chemotaxis protein
MANNQTVKRIFIVEDNLENRVITRLALTPLYTKLKFDMWGHDTVRNLQDFLPVDLIILDLMLPRGSSGYTVFQQIRQIPEFAKIPIVAVSAADPNDAIPRCKGLGFSGFISKPIDDDVFPQQINQILNGEPVWYSG